MKAIVAFVVAVAVAVPLAAQTVDFTTTYRGGSSTCTTTYNIKGVEPSVPGRYPVFVYIVGTNEVYDHASAMAAIRAMAAKNYVAATVQYPNGTFGGCSTLNGRAKCVFDPASASSAVSKICSRANADCAKGIVVGGFSQGSILSILAKNHDARVRAAYALGAGVQYSLYDLRACVADGKRTLPSDRLRAVNGEVDGFMGSAPSSVRSQLQELTGLSCPTSWSCFRANNSGWYMVSGPETDDGTAEHCYMRVGGCVTTSALDSGWTGTFLWSLDTNLQWLTGFTEH